MMRSSRAASARGVAVGRVQTGFARTSERGFSGYVVDPAELGRRFTVELLINTHPVQISVADSYVDDLAVKGLGDGCYGFFFLVDQELLEHDSTVEARLANLRTSVGSPIVVGRELTERRPSPGPGSVRWLGGLRFAGWIARAGADQAAASAFVDGQLVTLVPATGWTQIGDRLDDPRVERAFDLHLPERLADGRVHRLTIVDQRGRSLPGSPLPFQAFAGGLAETIARLGGGETQDAGIFDRLLPMAMPMSRYREWSERFPNRPPSTIAMHVAVAMVGSGRVDDTQQSLTDQIDEDWTAACLPATTEQAGFQPEDLRSFLDGDGANAEIIICCLSGTVLAPTAIAQVRSTLQKFADADAAYGDVEVLGGDGSRWPLFFPAFDYERMLEQGYCALLFGIRRAAMERALDHGASNLYRLFNAGLDRSGASPSAVVHAPGVLGTLPRFDLNAAGHTLAAASRAHLQRRGLDASVTASVGTVLPAVRVSRRTAEFETSIIVPTKMPSRSLGKCIESIQGLAQKRAVEVIVVSGAATDSDGQKCLSEIADMDTKVILDDGSDRRLARLCNLGAAAARSASLCLLGDRLAALDDQWLDEMLGRLQERDVGAVGALVLGQTSLVEHAGIVLGPRFAAAAAFVDRTEDDPGYGDMLRISHQCSALAATAILTRRQDYLAVGGLDELRFSTSFGEVDFCLKLGALGRRIVFTPHARFRSVEGHGGIADDWLEGDPRFEKDLRDLRAKWGEALATDPYYSPLLSLDPVPFSALAWPPRPTDPRTNQPASCQDIPPGF